MIGRGGMTCEEFKERAAAFALVALDDSEHAACRQHLASALPHLGCREAVAEAELVAARLGAALPPVRPAPHVWRAIAERLQEAGGSGRPVDEAARRRNLYHLCGWLVAAALVGFYLYSAPIDHHLFRTAFTHGQGIAGAAH